MLPLPSLPPLNFAGSSSSESKGYQGGNTFSIGAFKTNEMNRDTKIMLAVGFFALALVLVSRKK